MSTFLWPHTVPYFNILDLPRRLLQHSHKSTLGDVYSGGSTEVRAVAGLAWDSQDQSPVCDWLSLYWAKCWVSFSYKRLILNNNTLHLLHKETWRVLKSVCYNSIESHGPKGTRLTQEVVVQVACGGPKTEAVVKEPKGLLHKEGGNVWAEEHEN